MSKKNKNKVNEEKQFIEELCFGLDEYNIKLKVIPNPDQKYYDDNDSQFLRWPYAIEYSVPNSARYLDKKYKGIMTIDENGTCLETDVNGTLYEVDNPAWFYVGYSVALEQKIVKLKEELKALKENPDE